MKTLNPPFKYAGVFTAVALSMMLASCGDDNISPVAPRDMTPVGTFNLACALGGSPGDGGSPEQGKSSQQTPFQKKPECVQQSNPQQQQQDIKFVDQKVSDFDVSLDCANNRVVVTTRGEDSQSATLPIYSDGTVQGQLQFLHQLQDDGKGTGVCWVGYSVTFNGTATCEGPDTDTKKALQLDTEIDFRQTSDTEVQMAGIAGDTGSSDQPGEVPTPEPSQDPSPVPSPSVSILPIPTPTASVTPVPTPTASVTPPTVTPIKVCLVENACPVVGKTQMNCPE